MCIQIIKIFKALRHVNVFRKHLRYVDTLGSIIKHDVDLIIEYSVFSLFSISLCQYITMSVYHHASISLCQCFTMSLCQYGSWQYLSLCHTKNLNCLPFTDQVLTCYFYKYNFELSHLYTLLECI